MQSQKNLKMSVMKLNLYLLFFVVVSSCFLFKTAVTLKCYVCSPDEDDQCIRSTVEECFKNASPETKLMADHLRQACMTLVGFALDGSQVIGKSCNLDLSPIQIDTCKNAEKTVRNVAGDALHNITCTLCYTDGCNQ